MYIKCCQVELSCMSISKILAHMWRVASGEWRVVSKKDAPVVNCYAKQCTYCD